MPKAVKTPKTNAMRELEGAGIPYVLHTYEDDGDESVGLGVAISEQLGEEPGQGFKTLVCVTPSNDHVVCCIPVADELDLKAAARAAGEKSLAMMHAKDLLAATGYVRGGCSPVGTKKRYRTLIDEQKRRSIACFTESNDNSAMWGHYADSHRGFCIEYDFQKILTACSEKCADIQHCTSLMMSPAIAPVIYADVRYDASQIILPLLLSRMADLAHTAIKPFYEDLLVIVKSLLTKSSVWSYENEWRMISMLPDNTLFCRIYSLKPTSVYIGVRTDEEAANTLYQIWCEKDIPCYKMVPAYLSGSFSIRPFEYETHIEVANRLKQKSML